MSRVHRAAALTLRAVLPTHPSPSGHLPGYLRAFAAEPVPAHTDVVPGPPFKSASSVDEETVNAAYTKLVRAIFSQAVQQAQDGSPHTSAYEGLQLLEEQERAVTAGSTAGTVTPTSHVSRTMAALQYHMSMMDGTPRGRRLQENWQRQITLETRAIDAALAKYRREAAQMVKRGAAGSLPTARRLLVSWFHPLANSIREEQDKIAQGVSGVDRSVYGPFLLRLDPEQLAVIAMHAVINAFMSPEVGADVVGSAPGTARMTKLALSIGRSVEAQYNINRLERQCHAQNMKKRGMRDLYAEGCALRAQLQDKGDLGPEGWARWFELGRLLRAGGELMPLDHMEWFTEMKADVRIKDVARQLRMSTTTDLTENSVNVLSTRARRLLADDTQDREWASDIHAKVGVILIKLLMDSCKVETHDQGRSQLVPAFWHRLDQGPDAQSKGFWKKYGMLYADKEVMRKIKPHHLTEAFMPQFLPMLVTPVPWQRMNMGGHLTVPSSVMRMRGSHAQRFRLEAADKEMVEGRGLGLSQVYDALNALGETAWSINKEVYHVIEAIWAWGGGICDIPSREDVLVPRPLASGFRAHRTEGGNLALFAYPKNLVGTRLYEIQRARKKNYEVYSMRCDMEYKLAIAREFANEERFYFPHNVDFRGRAYPMHAHLNHLGSDMCRGMLQFADTRPLGPTGLRWLYIQAANLYGQGVDKLPLEGRIKWVEDNLGAILDNATDPFRPPPGAGDSEVVDGRALLQSLVGDVVLEEASPYWYLADCPFQFLATCFDIYRALASGDPQSYRSRLPVHQDGSCNGLQHYAALGRDLTGGWAVNLCPVERPQDVYSEIAHRVAKRVAADATAGVAEAVALQGSTPIDRKLVKQTVMTSVYGVTFVGARTQIGNRLRERGFEDDSFLYKVSCYSARVTLDCLHEMFQSAKYIMQWLTECARLVAKENRAVAWTTPLGLPVIQPYRRKTQQHVRTVLQRLVLATNYDERPVMKQRQRTAFPPNYVHSIDSSHMMLTAIACREAGLDFAGVHDSFWTHAGTVDQMSALLRETFIDLHSQPLLERLLEELRKDHPDIAFPPLPPRGELRLEDIRGALYFFS